VDVETDKKTGRDTIVVTEVPYQVNKARAIQSIAELVKEKRLEGISDLRDESSREGIRAVVETKRDAVTGVVLNNLYQHSALFQDTFGATMLAIDHGQPRTLGVVALLERFIAHRRDVVTRRTRYDLRKAREREHLLLGFKKALDMLDAVISLIRAAKNPREAREGLMGRLAIDTGAPVASNITFDFTERQAQAIIELQLQRLTGMEQQKILDELAEIQRMIGEYTEILGSEKVLKTLIVKELKEVQKDFGDERRTQIVEDTGEIRLEDLVQMEDVAVTVSRGGYLKRTSVDTYTRQSRGGKGRIGMGTRSEDVVDHLVVASTHSYLLIFTTKGRVYWLKIYEIPDAGTTGKGKHISGLINLQPDEAVKAFLPVKEFEAGKFIVMVTRQGVIKKCELTEFDNPLARGIIAVALDDGDELLGATITDGKKYIFLGSHEGMAIRFNEEEVRPMGRQARGVRAMDLEEGDYLIGLEVVDEDGLILSISENGYGKRTPLKDYRLTGRGRKGVINMKTTTKVGKVVAVLSVKEITDLMIITKDGKIIRIDSSEIRQAGRSTQGVRLVRMEEGDLVAAASCVPDSEAENGKNGELPLQ
jgi:DNA gyrase subunit A